MLIVCAVAVYFEQQRTLLVYALRSVLVPIKLCSFVYCICLLYTCIFPADADGADGDEHSELLNPAASKKVGNNNNSSNNNNSANNGKNNGSAVRVGGSNMCIYWQAPEVII